MGSEIGFLHKKLNINHTSLAYWIENEEFSEKIQEAKEAGITITERMVFEIMRDIYIRYQAKRDSSNKKPEFNFYLAKKAIVSLWFSITGTKSGWENGD